MTIETLTVSQSFDPGFLIRVYLDTHGAKWSLTEMDGRVIQRGEVSELDWREVSSVFYGDRKPLEAYIEQLGHGHQRRVGWRDPLPA